VTLPFARAAVSVMSYRPWLDEADGANVLFVSTHGYGAKRDEDGRAVGTFYPGSGASTGWNVRTVERLAEQAGGGAGLAPSASSAVASAGSGADAPAATPAIRFADASPLAAFGASASGASGASGGGSALPPDTPAAGLAPGGGFAAPPPPLAEAATPRTFAASMSGPAAAGTAGAAAGLSGADAAAADDVPTCAQPHAKPPVSLQPPETAFPEPLYELGVAAPHVINVAMHHGYGPKTWRRILSADVLPRLAAFQPDLILVSAGFDAHRAVSCTSTHGCKCTLHGAHRRSCLTAAAL
jgi:hypothetical protein